ncbi:unnamed protein product, partial [Tetraodon nigroviridis]
PFYPPQRTSFIFSGRLLTIILVFLLLALSLLLILPGIRGKWVSGFQRQPWNSLGLHLHLLSPSSPSCQRLFWMFRILLSIFIGAVIVALNFTRDWAEARMTTKAAYKSFSSAVVTAEVGLHVGLYGINVTLKGTPAVQLNETIDYNEMFTWHGTVEEEYEEALERGLPNPILYVAEKFTRSGACRLVSQYRYPGRCASATLWYTFFIPGLAVNDRGADLKTSPQVGLLLLVARQRPPQHAGAPVRGIRPAGRGRLHPLLRGLLLHRHECAAVCFPHRKRVLPHPVQPFVLAGSGYR